MSKLNPRRDFAPGFFKAFADVFRTHGREAMLGAAEPEDNAFFEMLDEELSPFAEVHRLVAQRRLDREDDLLPIAAQRSRIAELEGALRDLIRVGDGLKLPAKELDRWHGAALAAEGVLNEHRRHPAGAP
jgi:hypothetical protein